MVWGSEDGKIKGSFYDRLGKTEGILGVKKN